MGNVDFGDHVRVLVVEDRPVEARREIGVLHACGLRAVHHVRSAEEAVDAVRRELPDLALLEFHLNGTSGVELVRRLRGMRRYPGLVMLTASDDLREVREAFRAGAEDCLCDRDLCATDADRTLARVLASVLDRRRERMLGEELLATVAHDLLSPLANVVANAQLLGDERTDDPAVRRILVSAAYMRLLVEGTLMVARLEAGAGRHIDTPLPVNRALREAAVLIESIAARKDITIQLELPAGEGPLVDAIGIDQLVNNLLCNAVKFSPRGAHVIAGTGSDPGAVRIWVADEGPGIPERERLRIFEPFARGVDVKEAGCGLGLHIVQRIVAYHGGRVDVSSRPGGGTCFTVTLPAVGGPAPRC